MSLCDQREFATDHGAWSVVCCCCLQDNSCLVRYMMPANRRDFIDATLAAVAHSKLAGLPDLLAIQWKKNEELWQKLSAEYDARMKKPDVVSMTEQDIEAAMHEYEEFTVKKLDSEKTEVDRMVSGKLGAKVCVCDGRILKFMTPRHNLQIPSLNRAQNVIPLSLRIDPFPCPALLLLSAAVVDTMLSTHVVCRARLNLKMTCIICALQADYIMMRIQLDAAMVLDQQKMTLVAAGAVASLSCSAASRSINKLQEKIKVAEARLGIRTEERDLNSSKLGPHKNRLVQKEEYR